MKKSNNPFYESDGIINLLKALPYGLRHILAVFMANIIPVMTAASACGIHNSYRTRCYNTKKDESFS